MLNVLQGWMCRHKQRKPPMDNFVLALEAVWQETVENHLGAAFIEHGDSVIVK